MDGVPPAGGACDQHVAASDYVFDQPTGSRYVPYAVW